MGGIVLAFSVSLLCLALPVINFLIFHYLSLKITISKITTIQDICYTYYNQNYKNVPRKKNI